MRCFVTHYLNRKRTASATALYPVVSKFSICLQSRIVSIEAFTPAVVRQNFAVVKFLPLDVLLRSISRTESADVIFSRERRIGWFACQICATQVYASCCCRGSCHLSFRTPAQPASCRLLDEAKNQHSHDRCRQRR